MRTTILIRMTITANKYRNSFTKAWTIAWKITPQLICFFAETSDWLCYRHHLRRCRHRRILYRQADQQWSRDAWAPCVPTWADNPDFRCAKSSFNIIEELASVHYCSDNARKSFTLCRHISTNHCSDYWYFNALYFNGFHI
jgi:hypothetical protein